MIRRSTIVYIVLLLVLAGAYYYMNHREKPAEATSTAEPTAEVAYLFPAEAGTPSSIRMEAKSGETVEVARGADNAWALTLPIEAKADQGAAEAAASQVTTMRIVDKVPDVDPKIVGLENPEYVLTIRFTSGVERTVDVGTVTPSQSGYYVRDTTGKIVIVSKSAIDPLLELLQNPPYLETPTPSPIPPTETLTPVPATPEAGSPSDTATP
jgi:hypothetical protein